MKTKKWLVLVIILVLTIGTMISKVSLGVSPVDRETRRELYGESLVGLQAVIVQLLPVEEHLLESAGLTTNALCEFF